MTMITAKEMVEKIKRGDFPTPEELGYQNWIRDCDGGRYELSALFCRGGSAYRHKDGMRWANGDWFTKRQCRVYDFEPGIMNR